jgi:glycosidase
VWTTISADQADLNYRNPEVLLEIVDILLFYVSRGAEFIRLDAIAYLWKEMGTACINLSQTHWVVRLFRTVLDEVAPHVMLITETNVPHAENISYFGDGTHEAQLVYNFSLPPLVLHAFQTGNAGVLSDWASTLKLPSDNVAFFNFLASHDGIGLNPLRGILPEAEIEAMARRTESRGGLVSHKNNPDGTQSPYELNVNYFDALDDHDARETLELKLDRFVSAHAILLSFIGLPGIYFHSLFGSRGWPEGVAETGRNRAINRQKLGRAELERDLADENSLRANVFSRLSHLLKIRAVHPAFAPQGGQCVVNCGPGTFALLRGDKSEGGEVLCLHNVTGQLQQVKVDLSGTRLSLPATLCDLISREQFVAGGSLSVDLRPYQSIWLTANT